MSPLRQVLLTTAAFVITCCQAATYADPLVLSPSNPTLCGVPGHTLAFLGPAFNSGATLPSAVTITNGSIGVNATPGAPFPEPPAIIVLLAN